MGTHVFQPGDRFLESGNGTWTGVIDFIEQVSDDTVYAYAWRDDDPEHSRGHRVVTLTTDLTGARWPRLDHVELWDGGINGASTGVATYDCDEPGCDFNVSAAGTPDPDEPNYYAEDIEQHERGHEIARQRLELEDVVEPVGALTAPPGVAPAPPPGMTPAARQQLADEFAALAASGSVSHASSSQAGLASLPSLVQLDAEEAVKAAETEVVVAAVVWDDVRATGNATALEVAGQQLADTIATYRAVPR